jgi:peptidyl-tRNA hydrolase, PTH1 family
MKVVIGLGNPGSQYERTRHNVGWLVLDRLAERAGLNGRQRARDASVTVRGRYRDLDLALVKPTTYMNLSGVAVRKVLARERVSLEDLLIVVDDFDLPFGRLRIRAEGSAGTHNGLRSIVAEMGTQRFARLRVGIGAHGGSATDHVLAPFTRDEERDLELVLDTAADAVEVWATDGAARAADRFNAWRLPVPEPPAAAAQGIDSAMSPAGDPSISRPDHPADAAARKPDADGIVRTPTGWRRLLVRGDRGPGGSGQARGGSGGRPR